MNAPIRSKFNDAEIVQYVDKFGYKDAARQLSVVRGVEVSRLSLIHI